MSVGSFVKRLSSSCPGLHASAVATWNRVFGWNRFSLSGSGNEILGLDQAILRRTRIRVQGARNRVVFGKGTLLTDCRIFILGDDNQVEIGEDVRAVSCTVHVENQGNRVAVGRGSRFHGRAHLAATEGQSITFGEGCLLSSDITVRTGDSHSILALDTGARINFARPVTIGDRVWIGNQVIILKGSVVGPDSIVASGSLVTKVFPLPNLILAGSPARMIRDGVRWCHERLPAPEAPARGDGPADH